MPKILGISCFYHDSAACLVRDGEIVAAAQEERFSRKKHDPRFPAGAVAYCLGEGGLGVGELDAVIFYEKPLLKFDRLLASWLKTAPFGFRTFLAALPNWLKEKLYHPRLIKRELGGAYRKAVLFAGHHESHAASAFYPSPFEEAAILTIDGVGEWETATIGVGRGREIELLQSLHFPHSLGLLYSAFTYYLGFRVNSGEYKVMGLAPYGRPVYRETILANLIDLKEDGSFTLDQSFFNYVSGLTMTSRKFHDLFGGPPRSPETPLTQKEMDLAASLQSVTETAILRMAETARQLTG
ncbi:MAG: carbamoyltransferase family protein, partial [Oceanipulchritudo sp.]